jgi:hypothetical protein
MSSRFSRFLHLERSRGKRPGSDEQVRLRDGGRFESVAGPGEAPPTVAVPEAHVERFKRHEETPLALDAEMAEARNRKQATLQTSRQEVDAERQRYEEQLALAFERDRSILGRLQTLFTPSRGVGLLRLIPHPLARWATLAWAIGLPILLVRFGGTSLQALGFYLGILVGILLVPTSLWTARRGRYW